MKILAVSDKIVEIIYTSSIAERMKDIDFIVTKIPEQIYLLNDWTQEKNSHGNPKIFTLRGTRIDPVPLKGFAIFEDKLEPTINDILPRFPVNIASLIYDLQAQEILGEEGLRSIQEKTVRVLDMGEAQRWAQHYGKTIEDLLKEKAQKLGFGYEL